MQQITLLNIKSSGWLRNGLLWLLPLFWFCYSGIQKIHGWHFEDPVHFGLNRYVVGELPITGLWTQSMNEAYTPLTYTVITTFNQLFAKPGEIADTQIFHHLNLSLYLGCIFALHLLLTALGFAPLACFLGALVFAFHPLHVETVAWATCVRDLLSGFFMLISLFFFVRKKNFATLLFCLAAILSKPSGWSLLFLYPLFDLRRGFRISLWTLLFLPIGWMQSHANIERAQHLLTPTPSLTKILIALDSLTFYLSKLLFPIGLTFDYGRTTARVLSSPFFFVTLPVIPLLGMLLYRRQRSLLLPLGFFLFSLLPTLGLTPIIFQHISNVADRYAFLAVAALSLVIAKYADRRWLQLLLVPFLIYCALYSQKLIQRWESEERLLTEMVHANPQSWLGYSGLAKSLFQQGKMEEGETLMLAAIASLDEVKKRPPLLLMLSRVKKMQGDLPKSQYYLELAQQYQK